MSEVPSSVDKHHRLHRERGTVVQPLSAGYLSCHALGKNQVYTALKGVIGSVLNQAAQETGNIHLTETVAVK